MDTQKLIESLRLRGAETTEIEVKAGSGGLPKSLPETISAFANGSGGVILVGLTDDTFAPVSIDERSIRDALAGMASDSLQPPVRGDISIEAIDGSHKIVRFDVPEAAAGDKPCFVKSKGRYGGSYIRSGDGDRRLSQYEVDRLIENSIQPVHDQEIISAASVSDLDRELLGPYLEYMRTSRPRAFAGLSEDDLLRKLGVLKSSKDGLHPTLAALMVFGTYPQEFMPQLFISVVVLPGTTMGELGPNNERFIDNRTIEGPIPVMAKDAITAVTRHLTRASVMRDGNRVERLEYPIEVIRELIVNALMHRDYSPSSRGAQVQVEMYADRFVVRNPGGFYGLVQAEDLGGPDVSSSRNSLIAKMLTDTALPGSGSMVAENRGSGIPTVFKALNRAGMAPPVFAADLRRVEVTVPHHALLTPAVLEWIHSLGQSDLTQHQIQALALMRDGSSVRNQTLQGWGMHPADATQELTNLVHRGLTIKIGDKKGASYHLEDSFFESKEGMLPLALGMPSTQDESSITQRQNKLLSLFDGGVLTAAQITEALGVSYQTAISEINRMIESGYLEATAPPKSKNRAYRRTEKLD